MDLLVKFWLNKLNAGNGDKSLSGLNEYIDAKRAEIKQNMMMGPAGLDFLREVGPDNASAVIESYLKYMTHEAVNRTIGTAFDLIFHKDDCFKVLATLSAYDEAAIGAYIQDRIHANLHEFMPWCLADGAPVLQDAERLKYLELFENFYRRLRIFIDPGSNVSFINDRMRKYSEEVRVALAQGAQTGELVEADPFADGSLAVWCQQITEKVTQGENYPQLTKENIVNGEYDHVFNVLYVAVLKRIRLYKQDRLVPGQERVLVERKDILSFMQVHFLAMLVGQDKARNVKRPDESPWFNDL